MQKIYEKVTNPETNEIVKVPLGTPTSEINNTYYKEKLREEIESEIVDELDRIADLSNLQSLMFGFVRTIYGVLTTTQKDAIDPAYRDVMEYAINKYNTTSTSADEKYAVEGKALIDVLFARETAIGLKVKDYLLQKV